MINRWQESSVISALRNRRVVNLTGARQCGKTTLAQSLPLESCKRFTLDDNKVAGIARNDPEGFVKRLNSKTLVIDEIQKVPELLDYIKINVDRSNDRGQYLLTGSANLLFVKAVTDSLAGRVGKVRLRTLSLGEINGERPDFLDAAFERRFPDEIHGYDKRRMIELAVVGGYPETLEMDPRERRSWFKTYLNDLLMKDVRDVTEIRKLDILRDIAEWLLIHSSKFFDVNELATKTGVSKITIENYMTALKAMYLFDEVRPWTKNDYARIGKRSKYFAADSALIANIAGWSNESIYMDDDRCGKLIETWAYQNIASLADLNIDYEIFQYRDSLKHEIDFVVERSDGALLGIEVKSGTFGPGDFNHLKWFASNLAKGRHFTGIVLYSGDLTLPMGEGFYAVPLAAIGA
ncbi:MAG: ATP-binding protein [Kiritimatiellae bacterium]|nr:ATP-binding protein [Kiritimatiellia bacterium]